MCTKMNIFSDEGKILPKNIFLNVRLEHFERSICNELIEETARHRKLIFGESFGYELTKF